MIHRLHTDRVASVTDLKKHPMQTVNNANGKPLAILNRNEPVFYCVPARMYEAMMEALEDAHLASIVQERVDEEEIEVSPNDL